METSHSTEKGNTETVLFANNMAPEKLITLRKKAKKLNLQVVTTICNKLYHFYIMNTLPKLI